MSLENIFIKSKANRSEIIKKALEILPKDFIVSDEINQIEMSERPHTHEEVNEGGEKLGIAQGNYININIELTTNTGENTLQKSLKIKGIKDTYFFVRKDPSRIEFYLKEPSLENQGFVGFHYNIIF